MTPQPVIDLAQSLVEIVAFSAGDDRVPAIDTQNYFNFLGVLLFFENDLDG
jgi:hypothetical protein